MDSLRLRAYARNTRGEYMPMKLMKQNKKGKNLLRHLHRRNFFFINYILFYVTKCLRSKKKKKKLYGPYITTRVMYKEGTGRGTEKRAGGAGNDRSLGIGERAGSTYTHRCV